MPVHWGTFSLAMHAWDQPAEVLLERASKSGARLLMPTLGEPVEPDHGRRVEPWWRDVDRIEVPPGSSTSEDLPKLMPWPID